MAIYYFRNTGNTDWGTATNWSTTDGGPGDGAVPTSIDDVHFTSNSGNSVLSSNRSCYRLNTIGYTGTITINSGIILTTGLTINLDTGTTITGSGTWRINGSGTFPIAADGIVNGINLSFIASATVTFALSNTWNVNTLTLSSSALYMTGGNINVSGNLTLTAATNNIISPTMITLVGTGTWSGNFVLYNPLTINTSGTITISGTVQIFKSIVHTSGTVITTGSTLFIATAINIDTSNILWNNISTSGITTTFTLLSDLNIAGTLTTSVAQTYTFNGFNINISGSLTNGNIIQGTSVINMIGTGTWSGNAGGLKCSLNINTTGTITIGSVVYSTGTLNYVSGTIISNGTLTINGTCTLNTNGINWYSFKFAGTNTTTLLSNLTVNGDFTYQSGGNPSTTTLNGFILYLKGNILGNGNGGIITGSTDIYYIGTGTWSHISPIVSIINSNFYINTSGTFTISGTGCRFGGTLSKTFKYISGTVVTTSSTFGLYSCTIDAASISFNNISYVHSNGSLTLLSDINTSSFSISTSSTLVFNGGNININGSFTAGLSSGGFVSGTTVINLLGTGTWSGDLTVSNTININTSGTLTISGTISKGTGQLNYISGTVVTTGSTLNLSGATCTLDVGSIDWYNVTVNVNNTITLNSAMNITNTLRILANAVTFNGSFSWTCLNLVTINSSSLLNRTLTLQAGNTYRVDGYFNSECTNPTYRYIYQSSSSTVRANLILTTGGTQRVINTSATRIDSSTGETIYTSAGTLLSDVNWGIRGGSMLLLF